MALAAAFSRQLRSPHIPAVSRSSVERVQGRLAVKSTAMSHDGETAQAKNVLGGPLESCCTQPMTGFFRDGYCRTDAHDHGRHVVCSQVTREFLEFSRSRGNDLMMPAPWASFPGLKHGDRWCLCAARWKEALGAGVAPPVFLRATHAKALEFVSLEDLKKHALDADVAEAGAEAGAAQ